MAGVLYTLDAQRLIDKNGISVGGKIYFYQTGTTVLAPIYSDANLTIPAANPVVADAFGILPSIYLDDSLTYRRYIQYLDGEINDADPLSFLKQGMNRDFSNAISPLSKGLLLDIQGDFPFNPSGNSPTTYGKFALTSTDFYDGEREYPYSLNYTSNHGGQGDSTYQWDKCSFYIGHVAAGRVRNAWAFNPLIRLDPKTDGVPYNYVNNTEFDINQYAGFHFGDAFGANGFGAPSCHVVTVNGYSLNGWRATSGMAFISSSPSGQKLANFGVIVAADFARQCDYFSGGGSSVGFWPNGSYDYGMLFDGSYAKAALSVKNGAQIAVRNVANLDCNALSMASDNSLSLGEPDSGKMTVIVAHQGIVPGSDNTLLLGNSSRRWQSIWSANGVIQTSDPTLKTDVMKMAALDTGKAIDLLGGDGAIVFRWIVGGQKMEEQPVDKEVQDTEQVEVLLPQDEVVDGKLVRRMVATTVEQPLWDEMPVVDEAGEPIVEPVRQPLFNEDGSPLMRQVKKPKTNPDGSPMLGGDGKPEVEVTEEQISGLVERPKTHRIPRMVTKSVPTMVPVETPGKRLHAGFDASVVEGVAEALGIDDFGGFLRDESGGLAIRPDQIVAIAVAEIVKLRRRVEELETKVSK